MSPSKRLDVRVSLTLYQWVEREAKRQGFRTKAAYLRHVLDTLRLNQKQQEKGL